MKVINHRYTWAFAVDLLSKDVFVDYGLLCLWGLQKEYELELLPTIETWLADSELAALTIESATDISDRILAKSIKLVDLKLDSTDTNGLLVFKHDRKSCKIKCGLDFYVALNMKRLGTCLQPKQKQMELISCPSIEGHQYIQGLQRFSSIYRP